MASGSSMTFTIAGSPEPKGALERRGELLRAARRAPRDRRTPRTGGRTGWRQTRRDLRIGAVHANLRDADLAPRTVVAHDEHRRDREAHERVEVQPVEAEGAVAHHAHDLLAEAGRTDADRVAGADAEAPEGAGVQPVPRPVDAEDA